MDDNIVTEPGESFIPTSNGYQTPDDIVSDLTYRNYAYNRDISPDITPERWEKIYGPVTQAMEKRYQKEKAAGATFSSMYYPPEGVNKIYKRSWRRVLSGVDFKQKPDGTVEIDVFKNVPETPEYFDAEDTNSAAPASSNPPQSTNQKAAATIPNDEDLKFALASLPQDAIEVLKRYFVENLPSSMPLQELQELSESDAAVKVILSTIETSLALPSAKERLRKLFYQQYPSVSNDTVANWRNTLETLADLNFKQKTDGTVEIHSDIEVNDDTAQPIPAANTVAKPVSPAPQEANEQAVSTSSRSLSPKEWVIKKQGNLVLKGRECADACGIVIEKAGKVVDFERILKNGHSWRELINQAVWEERFQSVK